MEDKKEVKVKESKAPSIPQKKYTLVKRVSIGGEWREKGATVSLTEKGRQLFKKQGKIK